jgi:hypothetical protein
MNRSDEGRGVKPGLGRISRPNRDEDDDEDDVTTAQEGPDTSPENDNDESMDEGNESATQGERAGSGYQGQDAEERSEARQKGGVMGTKGSRAGTEPVKMSQEVSDSEEMNASAHKVLHGRGKPAGHEAEIEGSHQGSGHGRQPSHFSNLGHGEREATISGAHQGQHEGGPAAGSGFEAGGSLRKEHARGDKGP